MSILLACALQTVGGFMLLAAVYSEFHSNGEMRFLKKGYSMEDRDLYIDAQVIALAFLTSTMIVMMVENPMPLSRLFRKVFQMTTQIIGITVISFTYGRILAKFFALALTFGAIQTVYDSRYQVMDAKSAICKFINNSCNIMGGIVFINKFVELITTDK